jgi:four helix bundle protein
MPTFRRFEDMEVWRKAREATRLTYEASGRAGFARDFGLRDQLRRSCVSIMANIAEGHGRHSDKEFANFLNMAQGSAAEAQSHLYLALDLGYIDQACFSELYSSLEEISKMIKGLSDHLRCKSLKV